MSPPKQRTQTKAKAVKRRTIVEASVNRLQKTISNMTNAKQKPTAKLPHAKVSLCRQHKLHGAHEPTGNIKCATVFVAGQSFPFDWVCFYYIWVVVNYSCPVKCHVVTLGDVQLLINTHTHTSTTADVFYGHTCVPSKALIFYENLCACSWQCFLPQQQSNANK